MTPPYRRDDLRKEFALQVRRFLDSEEDLDAAQARYEAWFHKLDAAEDAELERVADSVWYEFADCHPDLAPEEGDGEWFPPDELRRRIGLYLDVLDARWPDPPPEERVTANLVLRPLTVGDNDMDYPAVMEAREFLRRWEGSGWPPDRFSLVENRDDLERHALEHRDGVALTYTVLASSRSTCLGCVYVQRLRRLLQGWDRSDVEIAHAGDEQAAVSFWMRPSQRRHERELFDALLSWPAERPYFHTNENCPQQAALFEASGLELRLAAQVRGTRGRRLLFRLGMQAPPAS